VAVTPEDVKHVAALARLGITDERAAEFTVQLNTILGHMDVLAKVDTEKLEPVIGVGASGMPLRNDKGPSVPMDRPLDEIGPAMRDGFFLVPRLDTHETADEA
jgi:aspartyl-tRNA(Asn)/glutamyl-tRNA(Gln) amidotransferase subunit C